MGKAVCMFVCMLGAAAHGCLGVRVLQESHSCPCFSAGSCVCLCVRPPVCARLSLHVCVLSRRPCPAPPAPCPSVHAFWPLPCLRGYAGVSQGPDGPEWRLNLPFVMLGSAVCLAALGLLYVLLKTCCFRRK
jgi:hypothetical protein